MGRKESNQTKSTGASSDSAVLPREIDLPVRISLNGGNKIGHTKAKINPRLSNQE